MLVVRCGRDHSSSANGELISNGLLPASLSIFAAFFSLDSSISDVYRNYTILLCGCRSCIPMKDQKYEVQCAIIRLYGNAWLNLDFSLFLFSGWFSVVSGNNTAGNARVYRRVETLVRAGVPAFLLTSPLRAYTLTHSKMGKLILEINMFNTRDSWAA